jgi:hypothetical protein
MITGLLIRASPVPEEGMSIYTNWRHFGNRIRSAAQTGRLTRDNVRGGVSLKINVRRLSSYGFVKNLGSGRMAARPDHHAWACLG